ncbi:hypothetical protein DSW27_02695 [Campylobacter coli]
MQQVKMDKFIKDAGYIKKLEVNQTQTLLNRNKIMLKYFVSISNQGEEQ